VEPAILQVEAKLDRLGCRGCQRGPLPGDRLQGSVGPDRHAVCPAEAIQHPAPFVEDFDRLADYRTGAADRKRPFF
jgi:hypothetical protein